MNFSTEQLIANFESCLSETMENLTFMEIEEARDLEELPQPDSTKIITEISVLSPIEIRLALLFPRDLIDYVMAELAGEDLPDADQAMLFDTAGELANTLSGRLAAELLPDCKFELSLPKSSLFESIDAGLSEGILRRYRLEDWELCACIVAATK